MKLFGYQIKITINKIEKPTAQSVFRAMEYQLRYRGSENTPAYFKVKAKMYKEIKRLAKEDYDYHTEGDEDIFPRGEDISYYNFEIVKKHPFGYVTFKI